MRQYLSCSFTILGMALVYLTPLSNTEGRDSGSFVPADVSEHSNIVLYSNERFTFYPDRMVAKDCYTGVYRSTDGKRITKDGDSSWTWDHRKEDKLHLQTPYPILNAVFALAVSESLDYVAPAGTNSDMLCGDEPGGQYYYPYFYYTHGRDIREYTRDTAQHIEWGDSVILDRNAAKGSILRRCNLKARTIREDACPTADSLHLIIAALEYYKITGDRAVLADTWDCFQNTIQGREREKKIFNDLWTGSPWSDHACGFASPTHFNRRNSDVVSLYGNTIAAGAWRALGRIAVILGKDDVAKTAAAKYRELKTAIRTVLYNPKTESFGYYRYLLDGSSLEYREDISAGMIYLYGIADAAEAAAYHSKFTATPYGYRNLDPMIRAVTPPPHSDIADYHIGNIWENQEAYHGWLMNRLRRPDDLKTFVFWHARAGLPLKEWREGTRYPATGEFHANYKHLVWGALGYTSYWTRGIFGICYDVDGIHFQPCVSKDFGDDFRAVLNNFTYRDCNLKITLNGCGTTLTDLRLNGRDVTVVPPDLKGNHEVTITMCRKTRHL